MFPVALITTRLFHLRIFCDGHSHNSDQAGISTGSGEGSYPIICDPFLPPSRRINPSTGTATTLNVYVLLGYRTFREGDLTLEFTRYYLNYGSWPELYDHI